MAKKVTKTIFPEMGPEVDKGSKAKIAGEELFSFMSKCIGQGRIGTKESKLRLERLGELIGKLGRKSKIEDRVKILGEIKLESNRLADDVLDEIRDLRLRGRRKEGLPLKASVFVNFLSELPEGWELTLGKRKAEWLHFTIPIPTFTLEHKGLRATFNGLSVVITCSNLDPLRIYLQRGSEKPHTGAIQRLHPCSSPTLDSYHSICYGASEGAAYFAMETWNIIALYTLFLTVVKTYSPNGYAPLLSFTDEQGAPCARCGRWMPKAKVKGWAKTCSDCGAMFCSECALKEERATIKEVCFICGIPSPFKCRVCSPVTPCNTCGGLVCSVHRGRCKCGRVTCSECNPNRCPICAYTACSKHSYIGRTSKTKQYSKYGICKYCVKNHPHAVASFLIKREGEIEVRRNQAHREIRR